MASADSWDSSGDNCAISPQREAFTDIWDESSASARRSAEQGCWRCKPHDGWKNSIWVSRCWTYHTDIGWCYSRHNSCVFCAADPVLNDYGTTTLDKSQTQHEEHQNKAVDNFWSSWGDSVAEHSNNVQFGCWEDNSNSFTNPQPSKHTSSKHMFHTNSNNNQYGVYNDRAFGSVPSTPNSENQQYMNHTEDGGEALKEKVQDVYISVPPELFEKLYFSKAVVNESLSRKFGNPTPIALIGIIIALTPLSCDLMGWRGADSNGAAGVGSYFSFGGVLTMLGGVLEYFLGNTFPAVVFTSFGAVYFSWAATLIPFFNSYGFYTTLDSTGQPMHPVGWHTAGFNSTMGFFFLFMTLLCVVYLICALRTNLVFVFVFFNLTIGFGLLVGEYFQKANAYGKTDPNTLRLVNRLEIAAGAVLFVTCLAVWYDFLAIMLEIMGFPFQLPVGDLSKKVESHPHEPAEAKDLETMPEIHPEKEEPNDIKVHNSKASFPESPILSSLPGW